MVYKAKYANQKFNIGDTRVVRKFAWLPKRIKDDYVWLETYETLEYYELVLFPMIGSQQAYNVYRWTPMYSKIIPKNIIEIKQ